MKSVIDVSEGRSISYDSGQFYLHGINDTYSLSEKTNLIFALPILEKDAQVFDERMKEENVSEEKTYLFKTELIKYCFIERLEYWSNRALNWVDPIIQLNEQEWARGLEKSWMSQPLLQKFRMVFKLRSYGAPSRSL